MTSSRPRARSAAPFLVLLLAACGTSGWPDPLPALIHLDPRLEDGRSPAIALADTSRVVFAAGPGELELDGGLVRVVPPPDAAEADVVEVEIDGQASGRAVLRWGDARVAAPVEPGAPVRFAVRAEPAWSGTIPSLTVELVGLAAGTAEVRRVTGRTVGLTWGDAPQGGERGDAGLVEVGRDARRAWPTDLGVALVTEPFPAGRLARFRSWVRLVPGALPGAPPGGGAIARVAVAVNDGPFEPLAEVVLDRVGERVPVDVDLEPFARSGDTLRLRLVVAERGNDAPGELRRTAAYWSVPRVTADYLDDRNDLVLVTLDTTRDDAVGEGRGITPFLDALAAEGRRFPRTFSSTNSTQPSHASLLTGLAMQDHGVADNYSVLPSEVTTVTERLRSAGYLTVAAVSQPCIGLRTGLPQGFDVFVQPSPTSHLDGSDTIAALEQLLGEVGNDPLFVWLHLYDPHTPYTPPASFVEEHVAAHDLVVPPRDREPPTMPELDVVPPDMEFLLGTTNLDHAWFLYDAGVSYADRLLERWSAALADAGRIRRTAWVVTADHGESLGERDSWFNHRGLFAETTRVPLIVSPPRAWLDRLPPEEAAARRIASSVDVAPTLLDLAGIAPDGLTRGESLLRPPRGERVAWFEHANGHQVGFTDGSLYFVTTLTDDMTFGLEVEVDEAGRRVPVLPTVPQGTSHLFDLETDPEMQHDLAAERPELVAECLERVERWRDSAIALEGLTRDMSEAERDALDALGYADQRQ